MGKQSLKGDRGNYYWHVRIFLTFPNLRVKAQ